MPRGDGGRVRVHMRAQVLRCCSSSHQRLGIGSGVGAASVSDLLAFRCGAAAPAEPTHVLIQVWTNAAWRRVSGGLRRSGGPFAAAQQVGGLQKCVAAGDSVGPLAPPLPFNACVSPIARGIGTLAIREPLTVHVV